MTLVESLLFKTSHDILVAPTILEDFLALPDHRERNCVVYLFVLSCTEEEEQAALGRLDMIAGKTQDCDLVITALLKLRVVCWVRDTC